ncbi:MAG: Cysteine desulfurase, partial [Myxococcaceae bacterium]|nr:Cysteine desulfurase [Myxococcaceae bacterium]
PSGASLPEVARQLLARGVCASTPDGLLRFAPHFANSVDEIPMVVSALRDALA